MPLPDAVSLLEVLSPAAVVLPEEVLSPVDEVPLPEELLLPLAEVESLADVLPLPDALSPPEELLPLAEVESLPDVLPLPDVVSLVVVALPLDALPDALSPADAVPLLDAVSPAEVAALLDAVSLLDELPLVAEPAAPVEVGALPVLAVLPSLAPVVWPLLEPWADELDPA